jgi:hypothetical protein
LPSFRQHTSLMMSSKSHSLCAESNQSRPRCE